MGMKKGARGPLVPIYGWMCRSTSRMPRYASDCRPQGPR